MEWSKVHFNIGSWLCCRIHVPVFSEPELTFTFTTCYRPSVRLSSGCNVRAPYLAGWNFRQFFDSPFGTLAIRWRPRKISRRSSERNLSVEGGGLNTRGVAKYSDFWNFEHYISRKRCKIAGKLALITDRKSCMSFRLVAKSVTLNGEMALIMRYFTEFVSFRRALRKSDWQSHNYGKFTIIMSSSKRLQRDRATSTV